jgi:hypothetical protein
MKKFLVGIAAMPLLASVSIAGQPALLSDTQMDKVSAGGIEINGPGFELTVPGAFNAGLTLQFPGSDPHTSCFGSCGVPSNPNFENPNTFDLIAVPGFGLFRGS